MFVFPLGFIRYYCYCPVCFVCVCVCFVLQLGLRCLFLTESFLTTFTALVEAWIDAYVDPSTLLVSLAFSKFLPVELGCPRLAGVRLVWAADSTLTGEVHVSHDASDA